MPVALISTSTSPAFGPSRSSVSMLSGSPAFHATAARVCMPSLLLSLEPYTRSALAVDDQIVPCGMAAAEPGVIRGLAVVADLGEVADGNVKVGWRSDDADRALAQGAIDV